MPAIEYPELVEHLAKITYHTQELFKLATPSVIGGKIGISKQGFQYHVKTKGKKA